MLAILVLYFALALLQSFGPDAVPRTLIRMAIFGASIALLAYRPGTGSRSPLVPWAMAILALLAIEFFHPSTNTLAAGLAQVAMYAAILGPVFWANRFRVDPATFGRICLIFWIFHATGALLGILQARYPGRFMPNVSDVVLANEFNEGLKITLSSGERIWRPMGHSDSPGGAARSGLYACIFALPSLLGRSGKLMKAIALASMVLGLCCIYLCQVRSMLVLCGVALIASTIIYFRRGELGRMIVAGVVVVATASAAFLWATSLAEEAVVSRYETLTADDAATVYYQNRGHFLEHTVRVLLPRYPLGAGLGRWGMMNHYFGDNSDPTREMIWVEIQWTGWLLDGGLPLIILYTGLLLRTLAISWSVARSRRSDGLDRWAIALVGFNLAALAVTFNYPLFIGQGGLEFWFLNAGLIAALQAAPAGIGKPMAIGPREPYWDHRQSRDRRTYFTG